MKGCKMTSCLAELGSAEHRLSAVDYTELRELCGMHNSCSSAEEAHKTFMNSYKRIFVRPRTSLPRIHLENSTSHTAVQLRGSESSPEVRRHQSHAELTQESHIGHVIRALKKLPIERSQYEHHVIYKHLRGIHCVNSQLGPEELKRTSTISTVETWDRGQIIFGHNGFYVVLMGSVKPYNHETSKEDHKVSTIPAGGSFGSFGPVNAADGDAITQHVLTQEPCEVLKISRSGYEKLRKDILAQDRAVKMSLIQGCQLYLHWPKLSINRLADVMQLKTFPANQVLVKDGKVCQFVLFVAHGECDVLQDVGSFMKATDKKGCKIKSVVVGKLGPKQSFGEVSILLDQPSPWAVITNSEVHAGIIQSESLKGLDAVTSSLILQTAQPMCGKLSKEEILQEFQMQERMKKWQLEKRKVLSDAVFYNGVHPGSGKWTYNRGPRGATGKLKFP